jgi:NAD(P)-dependent dehydrogenase (short-subunit alcohol dehydrogenase family)
VIASPDSSRVALVTGGARGIGAAVADVLHEGGLRVATVDTLPADVAGRLHVIADVSIAQDVQAAINSVIETYGRLDVLVNNAGILDAHPVEETDEATWDRVMAVNVKSVYLASRAAIPLLRTGGGGAIINVSSVHALATVPRLAAYAASKGAVLALSRQMALDCADDNITVNAVVVGSVDTVMSTQHGAAMAQHGAVPTAGTGRIGRTAQPREVAQAIAFLASPQASFITGAPLIVDGGMLARLV